MAFMEANEALVFLLAFLQLRITYASPAGSASVIARIIVLCACVAHAVTSLFCSHFKPGQPCCSLLEDFS